MATIIEQHLSKKKMGGTWRHNDYDYRGPIAYIDLHGYFDNARKNNCLSKFVRDECIAKDRTYAQAQKEETVALIRANKLGLK